LTPVTRFFAGLPRRAGLLAGVLLVLAAAILYGTTLDDGVRLGELTGGDLVTHHYAQVQGRFANQPGYPAYTMLGWLWFHLGRLILPGLNATQVLSLYSTLWALATLALFYVLLLEVMRRPVLAALVAGFYGVTYFFWYYAVTSEDYLSAVFQTLLFILWAFRWQRTRADRYLLYSAVNAGFCLSNLVTTLIIVPPLIVFYLIQEPGLLRRGRLLLKLAALALLPLLSYTYVFWAGATHPEWRAGVWPSAWAWFVDFISITQARSEMAWSLGPFTAEFPSLIVGELGLGVLALSLLGIAWLGRRRAGLIYAGVALYLAFGYVDRFGNWYQTIMPIYPLLLLGLAALLAWTWGRLDKLDDRSVHQIGRRACRAVILAGLAILIAARGATNWPRADQSRRPDDDAIPLAKTIVADGPAAGALIYGTSDELAALSYLTQIWGERSDLRPATTADAQEWLASAGGPPLYVTRTASALFADEVGVPRAWWAAGATLVEVLRRPRAEVPAGVARIDRQATAGLTLVGFERWPGPPDRLHVALYWRCSAELPAASVSLRPTRAGGYLRQGDQLVAQDHPPVWGIYPFDRWQPGEVVRDDYVVALPAGAQPDGLTIILYQPAAGAAPLATLRLPL